MNYMGNDPYTWDAIASGVGTVRYMVPKVIKGMCVHTHHDIRI